MNRPYIICHMVTSIDGKVTGKFLESDAGLKAAEQYYKIHREFDADGFICGRLTMESWDGRIPSFMTRIRDMIRRILWKCLVRMWRMLIWRICVV